MEHIWSPWRYKYVTGVERTPGCVFCNMLAQGDDAKMLIVVRGLHNFVVLNKYPYTSGHVMVVPYQHESSLAALDSAITTELMELTKQCQIILEGEYKPDGFNVGVNLGKAAGAGVQEHVHLHVVPRWLGDANFVSVIGETRVMPESLEQSYERLRRVFAGST